MTPIRTKRPALRLMGTTALILALGAGAALAQVEGCALEGGVLPPNCVQASAGTVRSRAVQPNVEDAAASAPGELGFSISIDSAAVAGDPVGLAGAPAVAEPDRRVDRMLDEAGVAVTFDGLGAKPVLNVSTGDLRSSYAAGDPVAFRASTNYPAWIVRAEVRVTDRQGRLVAALPVVPNGTAAWTMPAGGEARMAYALRVYDAAGRYDETAPLPVDRTAQRLEGAALTGPVIAAGEAEDRTARRRIPVAGGAVTVSGEGVPPGAAITVLGERVPVDAGGSFVVQRILPPGDHGVSVGVTPTWGAPQTIRRDVTIPASEWFATGIADVTVGRDTRDDETYRWGRIAGFARGTLADGTRITASVDTREDDLGDLFRDVTRKHPDQILRNIEPSDVFVAMGDDSVTEDLAPTSGKLYLRVDQGNSYAVWGDFKPATDPDLIVRSDRALYGAETVWETPDTTANGDARLRFSVYAAEPDTLVQRDVLRGTGGSAYFLTRQDILSGTETLVVEFRDPVSGRVVDRRVLSAGTDYRIDYLQGVVFLTRPLAPGAGAGGIVIDRPLGDLQANLVAQYEYVPTTGSVDGVTYGGRVEGWASDTLRFGAGGVRDTTGLADSRLTGGDILWKRSETTWLKLEYATSEGPGFGTSTSLNGGLTIGTVPTAGAPGQRGRATRAEGRLDLAEFGLEGWLAAYDDRRTEGFVSPDDDIATGRRATGAEGRLRLDAATELTFAYDRFADDEGQRRTDSRFGALRALGAQWTLGVEIARTDRANPGSTASDDNGDRTDAGARLTYAIDADTSAWVFGQATLERSGPIGANNRLGAGYATRLTDRLAFAVEASGGNLGPAGAAELTYAPNAGTTYALGYRLDPVRVRDVTGFEGTDRGTIVLGAASQVSDRLSYRAENSYSAFGRQPALTTTYGVTLTPTDVWTLEGGLVFGRSSEADGTDLDRAGLSLGARYTTGEAMAAGLRAEVRREDSTDPDSDLNRLTYLLAGTYERQTSEDWRFFASLDAVVSDSDQSSFRDGRYVEAKLGYAFRPADNDRLNALVSYSYLEDLPGADQVNIDGDRDGDRQRSHILNAALSYDLTQRWTLGAKYGFRTREQAARGTEDFTRSAAHLGVLRIDYHVVETWDLMLEGRALYQPRGDVTEFGAVAGVYRHVGGNLKLGAGYAWGTVSDDLRTIDDSRAGPFINIVATF